MDSRAMFKMDLGFCRGFYYGPEQSPQRRSMTFGLSRKSDRSSYELSFFWFGGFKYVVLG